MPTTAITRAAISVTQLMTPADVERESRAWSANCGPCALAAVLGVPVQRVLARLAGQTSTEDRA